MQVSSLSTPSDKPLDTSDEGNVDESYLSSRPRPVSRVSSYMSTPIAETPTLVPEDFPRLRNPDNVYYRPDCNRMAETLKVIMMTQDSLDPVPVIYNSHILHLLESFQDGQEQLARKQHIIEEVKEAHVRDLQEFGSLADVWEAKEKDYKAEIKRLELMLSKTEGGMETVVLARSKSKIHGSKRFSETLGRGFGTIKDRYASRERQDKEDEEKRREIHFRAHAPHQGQYIDAICRSFKLNHCAEPTQKVHFHTDISALRNHSPILQVTEGTERSSSPFVGSLHLSQPSRSGMPTPEIPDQEKRLQVPAPSKSFYGHILRPQRSRQSLQIPQPTRPPTVGSSHLSWQPQPLTIDKLEELQRYELSKQHEALSGSSTSESSSDDFRSVSNVFNTENALGIGEQHEKPLPDITDSFKVPRFSVLPISNEPAQTHRRSKVMSFSFQPGDDADILSPVIGGDFKNRERLEKHIHHLEVGKSEKNPPRHQRPKSISSPDPPSRKMNDYLQKSLEEQKLMSREISSNSTVMNSFQRGLGDQKSPDGQKNLEDHKSLSGDSLLSIDATTDRQKSYDTPKRLTRDDSSSSAVTAVRHNSGRSSLSTNDSARKIRPPLRRPSGSGSSSARGSSEAVAAAAWAFYGGKKARPDRLKAEMGSRGESKQRGMTPKREMIRKSDEDGKEKYTWRSTSRIATPVKEGEILRTDKKATTD